MTNKQTNPATVKVFVYGSLKKGFPLHGWMSKGKFITDDTIKGFTLIGLGAYPALLSVAASTPESFTVNGEVYELPYKQFHELAVMEEAVGYETRTAMTALGHKAFVWVFDDLIPGLVEWKDTTKYGVKKPQYTGTVVLVGKTKSEDGGLYDDDIPF